MVRSFKRIFNALSDPLVTVLRLGFHDILEMLEPGMIDIARPVLLQVRDMEGVPDSVKQTIDEALSGKQAVQLIALIPILMIVLVPLVTASIAPVLRTLEHTTDTVVRSNRASPDALWAMLRRGELDQDKFNRHMRQTGWADDQIEAWGEITRALLSGGDFGQAYLRGNVDLGTFQGELLKRGYSQQSVDIATELLKIIPGPQDLIRMAVREAWHEPVARKFGYDDDFPAEFAEWSEKIGLSADWAKRYWRAHWELPGVREGFEMLHRRIIDSDELELLMRSRDIPSFWRERLTKLSYRPFNRVDVRRMYREGVLSENEVREAYQDLGYNEEKAGKLTQWTISEYSADNRDLAKGDVLSAYQAGTITQADAFGYLSMLDYGDDEVLLLLARVDLKKEELFEKEYVQNVRVAFVGGIIEENDVYAQLGQLNPPAGFIEERLKLWRVQRQRSAKKPTLAQLKAFWDGDVIDRETLKNELGTLGYGLKYVNWFMKLWEGAE